MTKAIQHAGPHSLDTPGSFFMLGLFSLQCCSLEGEVKSLSCVQLFASPWTIAYHAPLSMGFSRQECSSGVPLPSPSDHLVEYIYRSQAPLLCLVQILWSLVLALFMSKTSIFFLLPMTFLCFILLLFPMHLQFCCCQLSIQFSRSVVPDSL